MVISILQKMVAYMSTIPGEISIHEAHLLKVNIGPASASISPVR